MVCEEKGRGTEEKGNKKTEVDLDRDMDKFAGCKLIIPLIPCH